MGADANRELVLAFLDAICRGDRAAAWPLVAEDATWRYPESLGGPGVHRGREAIFDVYFALDEELYTTGTREYDIEILSSTAEGDRVSVEMRHRGRSLGGTPYACDYFVLYRVRDGRIQAAREFFDTLYFRGVFPRPERASAG